MWIRNSLVALSLLCLSVNAQIVKRSNLLMPISAGGSIFFLNEDFEGTGTPAHWTKGGTANFDYTTSPAPLTGAQSLYIPGPYSTAYASYDFTVDHPEEIWFKYKFVITAYPTVFVSVLTLVDQSFNTGMQIVINSSGQLQCGNVGAQVMTTPIPTNTVAYLWGHYLKGTGSNCHWDVWMDTTNTKPVSANNHISKVNDTWTYNVGFFQIFVSHNGGSGVSIIVDDVQFATADF